MRRVMSMLEQLIGDSQALDRALAGEELSYNDGIESVSYTHLTLPTNREV